MATLTEAEKDLLWEAVARTFLDTTTYSPAAEADLETTVAQIAEGRHP